MSAPDTRQATPRDLWCAVDGLVETRQLKLLRDTGTDDWTTIPALWRQLVEAIGTGPRRGGRANTRTWTPLDLECMELAATIRETIVDALTGHDQRPLTIGNRPARVLVPESLRRLASVITATLDDDLTSWWTYRVNSWSRQITHTLQLEQESQPRRIRDTACPACNATHATQTGPDGPERVPALLIDFTGTLIRAATCTACGTSWFRGDGLLSLADLIAATHPERAPLDRPHHSDVQ
jgi:hypothetical protein